MTSGTDQESRVVVEAVSKLVKANEEMQQQLQMAESRLQEQAEMIDYHAKDAGLFDRYGIWHEPDVSDTSR